MSRSPGVRFDLPRLRQHGSGEPAFIKIFRKDPVTLSEAIKAN